MSGIGTVKSGDIVIPATYNGLPVTSIANSAFASVSSNIKANVKIPDSVTSIGNSAFSAWAGLTGISIGSGLSSIGSSIFYKCSSLEKITVDAENATFYSENNCLIEASTKTLVAGCKASIIPDDVTSIGAYAFYGCTDLTEIDIPVSVASLAQACFASCFGLTSITIPDSVLSIGTLAFSYCTGVTELNLNANVRISFTNLQTLNIGANVTDIGYCYSPAGDYAITLDPDNEKYNLEGDCLIEKDTKKLALGCATSVIPDDVASIGDYAFYGCTGLTGIDIPDGVTSIGDYAFCGCTGLTAIDIPSSVTSIGDSAFYGCTGLTAIDIPSSVTSIGDSAFYGCTGLTGIDIPDGVISIGEYAFSRCSGLASVVIPSSVTSIASYAFYRCNSLAKVYYLGTQSQWNGISISKTNSSNSNLTSASRYYFTENGDGETASGNWWYYDADGTIVEKVVE